MYCHLLGQGLKSGQIVVEIAGRRHGKGVGPPRGVALWSLQETYRVEVAVAGNTNIIMILYCDLVIHTHT